MRWHKTDVSQYVEAKEYIDSAVIPLISLDFSLDIEKNAAQNEILEILASQLERELTGRLMLVPSYYYIKTGNREVEISRLNNWVEHIKTQPFRHVFFLTFDSAWKKEEQALQGSLIWLPGIQSGEINSKEMQGMVREQVVQIGELIRSYW
ncbi:DUF2487 family protein [Oceanobacillus piezotolerans]|uniref:DUF2487 family protein n=1 Tax=Oceanobacillus piezotolerans TaxID=2448030 RepID=A0A498DFA9_9BACI|nr:YpiF family protein [Oceanobacillus piezotolerans]RLL48215.1 DUF2487 family protein [Oceanobacillus piezotolerans]